MNKETEKIDLPKVEDERGNLTFVENSQIPFSIKRVYWVYDVPGGQERGGHAFKEQKELIVSLSGSFDVVINAGSEESRFHLNRSYYGLYIPNLIWRYMENFSTNAVALVLASTLYSADDYVRDYDEFEAIAS
ncbi:sugar 3,4-ketoisomerase [Salinibacter ruber]|uniref:sugar 3,4-ketoisomerase n=1 Tax=Salinibacter ruber TaxID=146919 RepID=UPI00216899B5|nr:FdtA/QdtA family cupin domain-containing protein [Salinibacter ruber]MCS4188223.1 oxalate decarboxylase/phosphoglucose isomerase-like protein (cupin superfamily) [Salinibacter ruber]